MKRWGGIRILLWVSEFGSEISLALPPSEDLHCGSMEFNEGFSAPHDPIVLFASNLDGHSFYTAISDRGNAEPKPRKTYHTFLDYRNTTLPECRNIRDVALINI